MSKINNNWEKSFDERFKDYTLEVKKLTDEKRIPTIIEFGIAYVGTKEIKTFIRQELKHAREEERKELGEKIEKCDRYVWGSFSRVRKNEAGGLFIKLQDLNKLLK